MNWRCLLGRHCGHGENGSFVVRHFKPGCRNYNLEQLRVWFDARCCRCKTLLYNGRALSNRSFLVVLKGRPKGEDPDGPAVRWLLPRFTSNGLKHDSELILQ